MTSFTISRTLFTHDHTTIDSPFCKVCLEAEEAPSHLLLHFAGVEKKRTAVWDSPTTLYRACSDVNVCCASRATFLTPGNPEYHVGRMA